MARENSEPAKCIDSLLGVAKAFDFRALLDLADSDVAAVLVSFDSVVDYHENLELRALEIHQQVDLCGSLVPISGERCVAAVCARGFAVKYNVGFALHSGTSQKS